MLDREISLEIAVCVRKLKNNKTGGGSDGLVGEFLKWWVRHDRVAAPIVCSDSE